MTKILLLSDTHSYMDNAILKHARWADEVWHAGDIGNLKVTDALAKLKPLRGVHGNIDDHIIQKEFPENNRFFCEGVDVLITHIGGYPPKYNSRTRDIIKENPPKLFICGHSHILKIIFDKKYNLLHINPGAIGKHGFHKKRTMVRFDVNKDKVENLEVIEFNR